MKNVLIYTNEGNKQVCTFEPATGKVRKTEAMVLEAAQDVEACALLKAIVAANPDENLNIIAPKGLVVPVLEAMSAWKMLVNEEYDLSKPEEAAKYEKFITRATAAGIDTEDFDSSNIEDLKALALAVITNDWGDRESVEFMLTLALVGKHKFRSIDSLLDEEKEGAKHSCTEVNMRKIAAQMAEECKLPELQYFTVGDILEV